MPPIRQAPLLPQISETVRRWASGLNLDLIAVYLFGSYGTSNHNAESDLDLGVLAKRPLTNDDRLNLIESIQQSSASDLSADILDLSQADSVIAAQVITEGSRILTVSQSGADYFEVYVLSRYARLNEERKDLLADIVLRGNIYSPVRVAEVL